jgi:hypothetical protein
MATDAPLSVCLAYATVAATRRRPTHAGPPASQATGAVSCDAPPPCPQLRGGFFCDEPGLGKTVTALSLIMKTLGTVPAAPPGAQVTWTTDAQVGGGQLGGMGGGGAQALQLSAHPASPSTLPPGRCIEWRLGRCLAASYTSATRQLLPRSILGSRQLR